LFRTLVVEFGDVVGVVAADADDLVDMLVFLLFLCSPCSRAIDGGAEEIHTFRQFCLILCSVVIFAVVLKKALCCSEPPNPNLANLSLAKEAPCSCPPQQRLCNCPAPRARAAATAGAGPRFGSRKAEERRARAGRDITSFWHRTEENNTYVFQRGVKLP
jgi:hypothetical protein